MFQCLLHSLDDPVKINFGEPGRNEQPGYQQIGIKNSGFPDGGTFESDFNCWSTSCSISIKGWVLTRNTHPEMTNEWANISNILRSSFFGDGKLPINVSISGLDANTYYEVKTYHHSSYYNGNQGGAFTLQYAGNEAHSLEQSSSKTSPDPPLIHTETVRTTDQGTIEFNMKMTRGPYMNLNGMEISPGRFYVWLVCLFSDFLL